VEDKFGEGKFPASTVMLQEEKVMQKSKDEKRITQSLNKNKQCVCCC